MVNQSFDIFWLFRLFLIIADPIRELVKAFFDVRSKALIGARSTSRASRMHRIQASRSCGPISMPAWRPFKAGLPRVSENCGTAEQFAEIALHDRFCLGEIVRMHLAEPSGLPARSPSERKTSSTILSTAGAPPIFEKYVIVKARLSD